MKETSWADVKAEFRNAKEGWKATKSGIKDDLRNGPTWREISEQHDKKRQEKQAQRKPTPTWARAIIAASCAINVLFAIPIAFTIVGLPVSFAMLGVSYWAWTKYVTSNKEARQ